MTEIGKYLYQRAFSIYGHLVANVFPDIGSTCHSWQLSRISLFTIIYAPEFFLETESEIPSVGGGGGCSD